MAPACAVRASASPGPGSRRAATGGILLLGLAALGVALGAAATDLACDGLAETVVWCVSGDADCVATCIAVSGTGDARCFFPFTWCLAVSGTGDASGAWAVSGLGSAASSCFDFLNCLAVGGGPVAAGAQATASELVASVNTGDAQGWPAAVSVHGTATCNDLRGNGVACIAVSAEGDAIAANCGGLACITLSGTGDAPPYCPDEDWCQPCGLNLCLAASGAGDAETFCWAAQPCIALSGTGSASCDNGAGGGCLAASGTGQAHCAPEHPAPCIGGGPVIAEATRAVDEQVARVPDEASRAAEEVRGLAAGLIDLAGEQVGQAVDNLGKGECVEQEDVPYGGEPIRRQSNGGSTHLGPSTIHDPEWSFSLEPGHVAICVAILLPS